MVLAACWARSLAGRKPSTNGTWYPSIHHATGISWAPFFVPSPVPASDKHKVCPLLSWPLIVLRGTPAPLVRPGLQVNPSSSGARRPLRNQDFLVYILLYFSDCAGSLLLGGLSLVRVSRGSSLVPEHGLLIAGAPLWFWGVGSSSRGLLITGAPLWFRGTGPSSRGLRLRRSAEL